MIAKFAYGIFCYAPRHEEHASHRNPYGTAVQGVAGIGREDYGIHTKRCSTTEYGTYVRRVRNALYHAHSASIAAHVRNTFPSWATHGT